MEQELNYKGHTIKIVQDLHNEGPNEWGNTDVFLIYDHRQFNVQVKGYEPDDIFEHLQNGGKLYDGYHVFPVFAYIHSGVSLSLGRNRYPFTCPFDTSFKGFALVKRLAGWSYTRTKATKIAEALINEWNQYLSGDVYGFIVENSEGDHLDSCYGFYGDEGIEQAICEAKAHIDYEVRTKITKHLKKLKQYILNKVGIEHRTPLVI